jgi:hypothetical protein
MTTFIKGGIWSKRKDIPKIFNGELNLDEFVENKISDTGYKVYTALLTQTGTNAPVATVLQNTLGDDIIWSYSGTGSYLGTLAGAFTSQKTFFYVYGEATYNNGPNIYTQKIRDINIINDGLIGLNQTQLIFTNGVFSSAGSTNTFFNIPIEIRVYN